MIEVEVYTEEQEMTPLLIGLFPAMPRIGEVLSIMNHNEYFDYFDVLEVWYRRSSAGDAFVPCIRVKLDD